MARIGSLSILTNKSQVTCSGSWLWCWKYVQQPSQPLDPLVMVLTKCSLIAGPIMAIINHWLTGTHNIILAAAHCLSQSWLGCSAQVRNFYNMQNTQSEIFFLYCHLSQPTNIWYSWHRHKLPIWWIERYQWSQWYNGALKCNVLLWSAISSWSNLSFMGQFFNPPFIWFLQWNDRLRGSTGEVLAKYPLCAALCVGCRSIRRVMWELIVCGTGPMVTIGTLELDTGVSGIIHKVAAWQDILCSVEKNLDAAVMHVRWESSTKVCFVRAIFSQFMCSNFCSFWDHEY